MTNLCTVPNTTMAVGRICFGGNVLGWTLRPPDAYAVLDAFVDAGFNFIDTADMYSRWVPGHQGGESETVLGQWFRASGKRDRVVLATKVGMEMGPGKKGLKAEYITQSVEDSLRRLQTDRIDLYQAHQDDPDTPLDETLEAFDRLIEQGKVRAIGASNYSHERLADALRTSAEHDWARFVTLQPHYNLLERSAFETDLQPLCRRESLAVIPYFSLASGFLTGKYRRADDADQSPRGRGVTEKYLNARGERVLNALDAIAAEHGCALSTVALAWLLSRDTVLAPIVSATNTRQLQEILSAPTLDLHTDELDALDQASADA